MSNLPWIVILSFVNPFATSIISDTKLSIRYCRIGSSREQTMNEKSAAEIGAKNDHTHRRGAGDPDINTAAQSSCGNGSASTTSSAEANESSNTLTLHNRIMPAVNLCGAQSAHLCLLASKSPKSSVYKAYDKNKRTRTFIPHWVVEYPWLEFHAEKECMYCIYCREYQQTHDQEFTNTFVHGATNFRLDSVKAHDNSTKHRQVMLVMSGKLASIPKPSPKTSPKATGVKAGTGMDRLRIGAFFSQDHDAGESDLPTMCAQSRTLSDKTPEDHALLKHGVVPSADLTEDPIYPQNPMAKYLQTIRNIYPSLQRSDEMSTTEPHPSDFLEPLTVAPSAITEAAQSDDFRHKQPKEEPSSPTLDDLAEDCAEDDYQTDEGIQSSTSSSLLPAMKTIGRSVSRMRKVWHTKSSSMSSHLEGEEDMENGMGVENMSLVTAQEPGRQSCENVCHQQEETLFQQHDDLHSCLTNPSIPVYRNGKRTILQLQHAKRQKLKKILAHQMEQDEHDTGDDGSGDQSFQPPAEAERAQADASSDHTWRRLAESFACRYQQLSEEHGRMMRWFQDKVAGLEKKCHELDERVGNRKRDLSASLDDDNSRGACSVRTDQSSPKINLYSSVVVLQVPGREPVNIKNNMDYDFSAIQRDLAQSGIHIMLNSSSQNPLGGDERHPAEAGPTSPSSAAVICGHSKSLSKRQDCGRFASSGCEPSAFDDREETVHENDDIPRGLGVSSGGDTSEVVDGRRVQQLESPEETGAPIPTQQIETGDQEGALLLTGNATHETNWKSRNPNTGKVFLSATPMVLGEDTMVPGDSNLILNSAPTISAGMCSHGYIVGTDNTISSKESGNTNLGEELLSSVTRVNDGRVQAEQTTNMIDCVKVENPELMDE